MLRTWCFFFSSALFLLGCSTVPADRPSPGDAAELTREGKALYARGDTDRALTLYGQAIRANPDDAEAYLQRGELYATARGELDSALSDFSRTIELDPGNARAYYNRGKVHKRKEQLDRAIADYTAAVEIDPGYAQAYINRGVIYARDKEQYDLAIADFDRAIAIDPDLAEAYYNKALACEKGGRSDEAVEAYGAFIEHASLRHDQFIGYARQRIMELKP